LKKIVDNFIYVLYKPDSITKEPSIASKYIMELKSVKMSSYQKMLAGEQVFSTFDVLKILNIKRGRLVQWMKGDFLPKGQQVPWGKGSKTVFNINDLYSIALFKMLVDFGLSRKIAKKYMKDVNWQWIIKNDRGLLVIHPKKQIVEDKNGKNKLEISQGRSFLKNRESLGGLILAKIGFFADLKDVIDFVEKRI
jgi:hypothetical protein